MDFMNFRDILYFRDKWSARRWNEWEERSIHWDEIATNFSKKFRDLISNLLVGFQLIFKMPSIIVNFSLVH